MYFNIYNAFFFNRFLCVAAFWSRLTRRCYCPSHVLVQSTFLAILFLLLVRSSSNSPQSFPGFRRTLGRNFNWIRQQMKNFPINPIVKTGRFRQRYNVAESGQFLQWGSMGKFFTYRRIFMKFCTRVRQKPSSYWGEFELDRARSKTNIGENSVALGHETHRPIL